MTTYLHRPPEDTGHKGKETTTPDKAWSHDELPPRSPNVRMGKDKMIKEMDIQIALNAHKGPS